MILNDKVIQLRLLVLGFAVLTAIVLMPPLQSSLEKSTAIVLVARQQLRTFYVEYDLGQGHVITESIKNGLMGRNLKTDELVRMQGTLEKITIWHKKGKVWQIQKQNGQFILNYDQVLKKRLIVIVLIFGILLFVVYKYPHLLNKANKTLT